MMPEYMLMVQKELKGSTPWSACSGIAHRPSAARARAKIGASAPAEKLVHCSRMKSTPSPSRAFTAA